MPDPTSLPHFSPPSDAQLRQNHILNSWKKFIREQVESSGKKLRSNLIKEINGSLKDFLDAYVEDKNELAEVDDQIRKELCDAIASAAADLEEARADTDVRIRQLSEDLSGIFSSRQKNLRREFTDRFDQIDSRLKELDGQDILTMTIGAILRGNLAQVHQYCDGILLRDAEIVDGDLRSLPKSVQEVLGK